MLTSIVVFVMLISNLRYYGTYLFAPQRYNFYFTYANFRVSFLKN